MPGGRVHDGPGLVRNSATRCAATAHLGRPAVWFSRIAARISFRGLRAPASKDEADYDKETMQYTRLGSTGLKVSSICLGTMTYGSKKWREWVLDEAEGRPFIQRALALGLN